MLVNKTVEFFLSEVVRREIRGGWQRARSEMPAGAEAEQAAGKSPGRQRARSEMPVGVKAGTGRDADDQITGAGSGLGARCRGWADSGQMLGRGRRRGVPRLGSEWPGTG